MKLNTSLFICLFFSAIIAIKAAGTDDLDYDNEDNDLISTDTVDDDFEDTSADADQEVQEETGNQMQEAQITDFQYKPDKRLEVFEQNMPDQTFIEEGKVQDTLTDTYKSAMAKDVAQNGLSDANHEWQKLFQGPEAPRVFGTFGQNFNTVVTSADGADMINMLATTLHVLLAKAGEEKMGTGLSDLVSLTYSLFKSSKMPEIVSMAGGLAITAANKPRAPLFVKTFWDEVQKLLLGEKNLNEKLNKYFANIMSMMKSLSKMMQRTQKFRPRRRNTA